MDPLDYPKGEAVRWWSDMSIDELRTNLAGLLQVTTTSLARVWVAGPHGYAFAETVDGAVWMFGGDPDAGVSSWSRIDAEHWLDRGW